MNVITSNTLVYHRITGHDLISFPQTLYIYFSFEKLLRYGHNM